jgi:hypothetical protein
MGIKKLGLLTFLLATVFVPFLLVTNSCEHESILPANQQPVCFTTEVLPIFQNSCATSGCHNQQSHEHGLDLSTYSGIMEAISPGNPNKSAAYQAIIGSGEGLMPPGNPLSQDKRMLIRLWIEQGAEETTCPNESTEGGNGPKSGTLWACFDRDIDPILQSSCALAGCHNSTSHAAGIDLSSYSKVLAIIKKGDAAGSKLYRAITASQNSDDFMPPKPYSPLSRAAIDTIKSWINRGGLNEECAAACDTTGIMTYAAHIKPIMDLSCVSCHGNTSPSGGINLTSWSSVKSAAQTGKLLPAVKRQAGYQAMPPSYSLSDCEIKQIENWIAQGYN